MTTENELAEESANDTRLDLSSFEQNVFRRALSRLRDTALGT